MSVRNDLYPTGQDLQGSDPNPLHALESQLTRLIYMDAEKIAYTVIFFAAVLTRFWDLGARVMSHDESLHTRFAWNLYQGDGFAHTPLMHGPLLFHATAFFYLLFGDNDFTARIYPALLGVVLVMTPWFMQKWIGKVGAIATSVLFLLSPMLLYYSRYIRHDIPAIVGALAIAISIWKYLENRKLSALIWIAVAQAVMFLSKEVSFIYVAIFGSFLTIFFITRLFGIAWKKPGLQSLFGIALIVTLAAVALTALAFWLSIHAGTDHAFLSTRLGGLDRFLATTALGTLTWGALIRDVMIGVTAVALATLVLSVVIGQWTNLRNFPELDLMIVMGMLLLPSLAPLLTVFPFVTWEPLGTEAQDITNSILYTLPFVLISLTAGLIWGIRKPEPRIIPEAARDNLDLEDYPTNKNDDPVYPLDFLDWAQAALSSRALPIFAVYWVIMLFFFTTMFTNGAGIGTGVLGSLAYWLEQHGVQRGGQPWYYYMMIQVPLYEYLPAVLSVAAAITAVVTWINKPFTRHEEEEQDTGGDDIVVTAKRQAIDLNAPITAPVLLFTGYWVIMNFVAYSISGEKMPWLTTHLTVPMCILGGWLLGLLLTRMDWEEVLRNNGWLGFVIVPLLLVTAIRVIAPSCRAIPTFPLCNTIIPMQYQANVFDGKTTEALSATGVWIAAAVVFGFTVFGVFSLIERNGFKLFSQAVAIVIIGWLGIHTARTAWIASFVNYDNATEYLVYAHSAGAVKDMMAQIEELSLKTTDGYGLKIGYDNKVSWPMSWYFRDYTNAVYFAEQPSRGTIGDADVVVAGPDNWTEVERILGNRYYRFEYIRMWWPIEDYKGLTFATLGDIASDPDLQRGLWEIWMRREYDTYARAVAKYRNGIEPSYELSEWPVSDRMRFYVRKDVYAQVWEYGVAATELATLADPYSVDLKTPEPENVFGEGILIEPHGIAIGPDDNIYVADTSGYQIVVFSPEGGFVRQFGMQGRAPTPGVLNEPWDVTVGEDGTVYVADTWNARITVFDEEGEPLNFSWGHDGPGQTEDNYGFWGPRGIAVDNDGNIYVADTGNKRVLVFDAEGDFLQEIGSGGGLDGQLDEPVGLAIGPDDELYVADTWNQRIQVFNSNGQYLRHWYVDAWFAQTNERPYVFVDDSGIVYVSDPDASRIVVFDSEGTYLYALGDYNTLNIAGGVVVDDEGNLFVVDTAAGAVQQYSIDQFE